MKVILAKDLLSVTNVKGEHNRDIFEKNGLLALNIISSPGAGKTTLLEVTMSLIKHKYNFGIIEGDLYTSRDARRLSEHARSIVQINTCGICHLNAEMVARALDDLVLDALDIIIIENVGNLVCPASFYLGETCKVALLSVPEGSDKPAKYPGLFKEARAVVINKADLLPYTDFDLPGCIQELQEINPGAEIFVISATTGAGMEKWVSWLEKMVQSVKQLPRSGMDVRLPDTDS
ncbi:hydrogenase nickel incorporation protein HypB [Desulfotomaculum arcticum]|uniref:Hydrogenase nickel incorporation protein HypB n=1 Tax=Desulfotruncus arcticus DSM 17038 TaxID=1121424 RepID=A0A1I2YTT3_9FIRM|nr:hydrogenase nickel incorporation protein HypB [Desulfotruncus arcticus]SFH28051.1 hydrogenase nickel incorporation protein HypB [Desulfotomaculum arcticum] [Desulfotruncus arcticus DSM 17038]